MPRRSSPAGTPAVSSLAAILGVAVIALATTGCGGQAAAAGQGPARRTTPTSGVTERRANVGAAKTKRPAPGSGRAAPRAPAGSVGPNRPGLPANWQAGVNLTGDAAADYLAPGSDHALQAARADRSTSVEIVPTWYMDTSTASAVAADPARTATDSAVTHAVATAQALGLRVLLKPQVDVRDGTYRGLIAPVDRPAWFASYRAMLLHYATLARQLHVAGLVVGVELGSMVSGPRDTAIWRGLIKAVRRAGYAGLLTYAANWDQLRLVGFWRALSYIGIDAYFPLITPIHRVVPQIADLVSAWRASAVVGGPRDWVAEVAALARAEHLPVVFTELGYVAAACTTKAPYQLMPPCAAGGRPAQPSERAQQDAYVAALRVWSRVPAIRGIYWWDWPTDAREGTDAYSPRGKLAERTLIRWNSARGALPAGGHHPAP